MPHGITVLVWPTAWVGQTCAPVRFTIYVPGTPPRTIEQY